VKHGSFAQLTFHAEGKKMKAIIKILCSGVAALSVMAVNERATADDIVIEAQAHHLGDGQGNEGIVFEKPFVLTSVPPNGNLKVDFIQPFGPNLETPPQIFINGTLVGSIVPFFPPYDPNDPLWQLNPDGSHDYNGFFQVSFPVTSLLNVGSNLFRIQNGRPDDDYFFSNVILASPCQITSVAPPVPDSQWYQLDEHWGSEPYDHVVHATCPDDDKIENQGCGLIALNFALNAAGHNTDPISLNDLLKRNSGDYSLPTNKPCSGGKINWSSAVKDASGNTVDFDKSQQGKRTLDALDLYLCSPQPNPVVITVTNPASGHQHFVVVTGKVDNTYSIIDPGYLGKTRLSDWGDPPIFSVYGVVKGRNPSSSRPSVYRMPKIPSGSDSTEVDFALVDKATLLVTAPDGTQTGFDPVRGEVVKGSLQSAYFADDNAIDTDAENVAPTSTTYSVQWSLPLEGSYSVELNGIELGTYELTMKTFDTDGNPQSFAVLPGIADVGTTSAFAVEFTPAPGNSPEFTRVASFESTLSDVDNSVRLGLIDNPRISRLLSLQIRAAAQAADRKQIARSHRILQAFVSLVNAQAPQSIRDPARQILVEDANYLITR
jgi:hypothetical protein